MSCATCGNAEFELTPTGRIKRMIVGRCRAEIPALPVMPACAIRPEIRKSGIWPDMGDGCTFWVKKSTTTPLPGA